MKAKHVAGSLKEIAVGKKLWSSWTQVTRSAGARSLGLAAYKEVEYSQKARNKENFAKVRTSKHNRKHHVSKINNKPPRSVTFSFWCNLHLLFTLFFSLAEIQLSHFGLGVVALLLKLKKRI